MEIPANRRNETLITKIAGETVKTPVTWEVVESSWITMRVADMTAALQAAYHYRYNKGSEIKKAADGNGFLVTIKTKDEA